MTVVAVGVCLSKILITTLAIFDTETVLQQTLTWISLFCDVSITFCSVSLFFSRIAFSLACLF